MTKLNNSNIDKTPKLGLGQNKVKKNFSVKNKIKIKL